MKVRKTAAAVATSLGMVVGFAALAGAAPVSTINTTGPDSINKVKNSVWVDVDVTNHNNLHASNYNHQSAWTGDAKVIDNTTGGGATSGDAMNHASFNASATVNNSGSSAALNSALSGVLGGGGGSSSISNTGPDSYNTVTNKASVNVDVNNTNNLTVTNHNTQTASSGDASVIHNTTGGSATTGNASNTSNTTATFNVTN